MTHNLRDIIYSIKFHIHNLQFVIPRHEGSLRQDYNSLLNNNITNY